MLVLYSVLRKHPYFMRSQIGRSRVSAKVDVNPNFFYHFRDNFFFLWFWHYSLKFWPSECLNRNFLYFVREKFQKFTENVLVNKQRTNLPIRF
jgi:hypothetical protein